MIAYKNEAHGGVTLMEAVETLTNIADMDFERDIGVAKSQDLEVLASPVSYRTVHWLQEQNPDQTVSLIRSTFSVVLNYLQDFYQNEYRSLGNEQAMEEIKTMMVLVGDAAKKLDKYTRLFYRKKFRSVMDLKEYRELQEFYVHRIARRIDEGTIGKWVLGLTQEALKRKKAAKLVGKKETVTDHIFIDLDSVKKDTEYELFFLRKQNGTRFYNPSLIRNVKLVCDFGDSHGGEYGDDPLTSVHFWLDHTWHRASEDILSSITPVADRFYRKTAKRYYRKDLTNHLHKALMALFLSSNPNHLLRHVPVKSCLEYFQDFQLFLRQALESRDYQKLVAYPPKRAHSLGKCLLETTQALCKAVFADIQGYREIAEMVSHLVQEATEMQSLEHRHEADSSQMWWNRLASDYVAMTKLLKRHHSGPLNKIIRDLEKGQCNRYDPLMQDNVPTQLYSIYYDKMRTINLYLPSPIVQEHIHKAKVTEEFKAFIRSYSSGSKKKRHLYINLQDRTSWREHSRAVALEDICKQQDIANGLLVVTLAKDTEFYHQHTPYKEENHADVFIQHFKEHLADEAAGFSFPEKIKKVLLSGFIDGVIEGIHTCFFSKKNVLSLNERLNFIEIFYLFLEIKLIEMVKPDTFNISCKDGIDAGAAANAQLVAFMKIMENENLLQEDMDLVNEILYPSSLLVRERVMVPERFHRMTNCLKSIEAIKQEQGHLNFCRNVRAIFGPQFKSLLHWKVKPKVEPRH